MCFSVYFIWTFKNKTHCTPPGNHQRLRKNCNTERERTTCQGGTLWAGWQRLTLKKQHKTQSSYSKTHSVHLFAGLYEHFRQHDAQLGQLMETYGDTEPALWNSPQVSFVAGCKSLWRSDILWFMEAVEIQVPSWYISWSPSFSSQPLCYWPRV